MTQLQPETHWNRPMRCYSGRVRSVTAMFQAAVAATPGACAVVEGPVRHSYAELSVLVDGLAGSLHARGIGRGDRVAVFLPNGIAVVVAILAITRLGAILVPVGARQRRPELEYLLADAEPSALIYDADFAPELPTDPAVPQLRICVGGEPDRFQAMLASASPLPHSPAEEEDTFAILYTSGTTGRPKGAMLTHLGAVHSAMHWQDRLEFKSAEVAILCIPWSHVSGLCGVLVPMLHIGGTLVMARSFARRDFLALAAQERMTYTLMVPAMYNLCLLEPDLATLDLSSWRVAAYGGAPMPEPTIRQFAAAVPRLTMCNAYGATETTSPTTISPLSAGIARMDSIGTVVPCGEIRVVDEVGQDVPPGEQGELWIAGPMVVPGYWRNPQANAAGFQDGYWKSGDMGAKDAEGFVTIADRKKDMINRGGFKIYPAEVENVLSGQDGVMEVAIVGQPDPILGERSVAFVQARDATLSEDDIRRFCAQRMADYKVPDWVIVSDTPLPRNANGKVQKAELRAMAQTYLADPGRPMPARVPRN